MKTETIVGEVLGVPTEFEIKEEQKGNEVIVTVSYMPPQTEFDPMTGILKVYPPRQK